MLETLRSIASAGSVKVVNMIPTDHLLRRINVFATAVLADLHHQLKAFYSEIGRPSVDPELMIRMLLVGRARGRGRFRS